MTRVDTSGYGPSGDDLTSGKVHTRYAQRVLAFQPSRLGSWSSPVSRTAVLSVREERCFVVPKGQARIAQRFNAGLDGKRWRVPKKGRLRSNPAPHHSAVPSGPVCMAGVFPALKRRAILRMFLRNEGTWRPAFPPNKQPAWLAMLSRAFRGHGVQPVSCEALVGFVLDSPAYPALRNRRSSPECSA